MSDLHDLIIVGSGPAGHTAAVYAARANLKPLMFEGFQEGGVPGGQLMITTDVENYPGFPDGVTGPDLMANMRKQSTRFGATIMTQDVEKIEFDKRPFVVHSEDKSYRAKSLIIATGATAKFLGLENEKRLYNRGVSACATCDGALPMFRNKELIVIGGGDTAMEEASFLSRFASKVTVVHRRNEFRASKIMVERARANEKIEFLTPYQVTDVHGQDALESVDIVHAESGEKKKLQVAGMFVAIGHVPNTKSLGTALQTDGEGYIVTKDKSAYTNIDGVFACGDVQDHVYRQAITAAGSGCMAAIDAERWLQAQEEVG